MPLWIAQSVGFGPIKISSSTADNADENFGRTVSDARRSRQSLHGSLHLHGNTSYSGLYLDHSFGRPPICLGEDRHVKQGHIVWNFDCKEYPHSALLDQDLQTAQ